jgi:hypothetical protein
VRGAKLRHGGGGRSTPPAQPPDARVEVHQRPEPALPAPAHGDAGAERPARALQPGHAGTPRNGRHVLAVPARLPLRPRQAHAAQHPAPAPPAAERDDPDAPGRHDPHVRAAQGRGGRHQADRRRAAALPPDQRVRRGGRARRPRAPGPAALLHAHGAAEGDGLIVGGGREHA